jgi:hypothetical protein
LQESLEGTSVDSNETEDGDIEVLADEGLVSEAQIAPPQMPAAPIAPAPTATPGKEITEQPPEDLEVALDEETDDQGDAVEGVLKNTTVSDVIKRLERLSNIFRTREVPRQLALVDMMLDSLGIGSFFPGLGEAIRSALESNSYCSTRIEDVLTKLRGSTNTGGELELEGDNKPSPAVESIARNLEMRKNKDDARKKRRKEEEEIGEVPEQLAAPSKIEPPAPAPGPLPPVAPTPR